MPESPLSASISASPQPVSPDVPPPAAFAAIPGMVTATPRLLLRLEGCVMFAAAILAYRFAPDRAGGGFGWGLFALLFLLPDVTMMAYRAGPRLGAAVYNAGHTTLPPALLAAWGLVSVMPAPIAVALIWLAHIGFDRMLGYGLKYDGAFGDTHLGRLGRGFV